MDVIRLRAHHLALIYHLVVEGKNAKKELRRILVSEGYPSSTITTSMVLLEQVFSGTCDIEIVEGPDVICNSGCLKKMKNEPGRPLFVSHCINKDADADMAMMDIFDVVPGERYGSNVLIAKARALWQKHQVTRWQELIINVQVAP